MLDSSLGMLDPVVKYFLQTAQSLFHVALLSVLLTLSVTSSQPTACNELLIVQEAVLCVFVCLPLNLLPAMSF
jgi:hypothetical protein